MHARHLRHVGVVVVSVCALSGVAAGSPVNIDTFDVGSAFKTIVGNSGDGGSEIIADTTQTIGGIRHYNMQGHWYMGGAASLMVSGGLLGLGTMSLTPEYYAEWQLHYGNSMWPAADLNADLVNDDGAPNQGLRISMWSAEYPYDLYVYAYTNGPNISSFNATFPANTNPHDLFLPFSAFNGTANFHDVDQLYISFVGRHNGDYVVNGIVADVPEPATLILLVSGTAAALLRRRGA